MRAFYGKPLTKRLFLANAHEFVFNWTGSNFNWPTVFRFFTPNADWPGYHQEPWTSQSHGHNYERSRELGIPFALYLLSGIFERLTAPRMYTRRFIAQAPVGADLSKVWPRFALWLMTSPPIHINEEADQYAIELTRSYYTEYYQDAPAQDVHSSSIWEQWQTFEGYLKPLIGMPDLLQARLYRFLHAAMAALMFDAEHSGLIACSANQQIISRTAHSTIAPICEMVISAGMLQLLALSNAHLDERRVKGAFIHQSEMLLEFITAAGNQEDWIPGTAYTKSGASKSVDLLPLLLSYKKEEQ